jgi:glycosyltransferase involved in cell wall biosynthesis
LIFCGQAFVAWQKSIIIVAMRKVLWLASWYPNKLEPFNGDFIQRHARATALYNQVHVIHVIDDYPNLLEKEKEESFSKSTNLSEHIIYFKPLQKGPLRRWLNNIQYQSLFRKAIKEYIKKEGLPHCVHVHVPMKAGLLALWLKRKYKIPFVVTEHWAIYNDIVRDAFHRRSAQFRMGTRQVMKKAALFLPVSEDLGQSVNRDVAPVPYAVVRNVVDTNLFFYKSAKRNNGKFRFLHVSTMTFQKNPEGLLDAIQLLKEKRQDFECIFIGPHPASVVEYSKALDLYNQFVFFKGEITYPEVAAEMQDAHALVLFSRYENLPCVLGEAFCCGLPVISTRVGGIAEIVEEENGLLVENEDVVALMDALEYMVKEYDFYDTKKIAETSKKRFSYSTIGKQINDIYNMV